MKPSAATVVGIAGAVVAATFVAAPTAQAAGRDGTCQTGELCLYYNSSQAGSVSDFTTSISDYGSSRPSCYVFKGPGNGRGLCVKNNAASVWNRTAKPVTVHFNSGFGGASQTVPAGARADLGATLKNENASHRIGATTTSSTAMSYSLYKLSGGRVTAGFDGYRTTPGRHEGIDIARGIGSPVRALTSGEVVNVARGYRGSGGLSTIAIYNRTYDKTVIYLHALPLDRVSVGDRVGVGEQIGAESWRGLSSSSAAHTHVEMRLGRRTLAAKSVNDWTLENPDPTSFWNARGYSVR